MNPRERFHAVMNFKPFDRLPILEWAGWWDMTIERWHSEGLPASCQDRYAICEHFGLDLYKQQWLGVTKPGCPQPASHGAGMIRSEADYEAIKPYLFPRPASDKASWETWAAEQARGDAVLWFTVDGFFWFPRRLLGIEPHLFAFYDQPELMHRINQDLTTWILQIIDDICEVCTPDFMTFGEDMSYNHGPMLSEELFDTFLAPYYRQVLPRLKERGIWAIIDSDGDISVPAHWFERVGLDGILPLERQAGVDMAQLRTDHPSMRFIGHYDKMVMNRGEDAIRQEFERLLPVAGRGGFLPSCDHQTPPGVSYQEYRCYVEQFRRFAEAAGRQSQQQLAP